MKMKRCFQRLAASMLCLMLCALCLPRTVMASGVVDTQRTASLTVQYPLADAGFQLYRVANLSAAGEFVLTGDFAGYAVTLNQPDQTGWRAAACALAVYAVRDQLTPETIGKTDQNGTLTFSSLPLGIYLVVGQSGTDGEYVYTPEPFLVSLPGLNAFQDWEYNVTADPKYEKTPETDNNETIDRKVLKVWKDDGLEEQRPQKIQVELLRDGKVWDTVTLSADNNWRYTWTGLDSRYTWQVVEKTVPDGYTVTVSKEGITFVVTNTCSETPDVPGTPDIPDTPEEPSLPQTGMLWWPVPLLACCGMGLFLIGWARRRSEADDEK